MSLDAVEEPSIHNATPLVREVAAVPAQARILRNLIADWARAHGLPVELVDDVRLAVYEAMANVVEHAYPAGAHGTMTVTAIADAQTVAITVADGGRWGDDTSNIYSGRGLPLIRALAPEATVTSTPMGTTVRLAWPWSPGRL